MTSSGNPKSGDPERARDCIHPFRDVNPSLPLFIRRQPIPHFGERGLFCTPFIIHTRKGGTADGGLDAEMVKPFLFALLSLLNLTKTLQPKYLSHEHHNELDVSACLASSITLPVFLVQTVNFMSRKNFCQCVKNCVIVCHGSELLAKGGCREFPFSKKSVPNQL